MRERQKLLPQGYGDRFSFLVLEKVQNLNSSRLFLVEGNLLQFKTTLVGRNCKIKNANNPKIDCFMIQPLGWLNFLVFLFPDKISAMVLWISFLLLCLFLISLLLCCLAHQLLLFFRFNSEEDFCYPWILCLFHMGLLFD